MTQAETATRYKGIFGAIRRLKDWVEGLAEKRYALTALAILAISESIFFPIPVDVLLIALCVGLPKKSFKYATLCTLWSVVGGVLGYLVGYYLWYDTGADGVQTFSGVANFFFSTIPSFSVETFESVREAYEAYEVGLILAAGFTPLPYKIITITAGVFSLNLPVFILASVAGRGARFFLVAALFHFFGRPIKKFIDEKLEILSVLFVVLLIAGFVALKYVF
ncbi:MAG: VTT domain-containing protein [Bacteroidota bacterium]